MSLGKMLSAIFRNVRGRRSKAKQLDPQFSSLVAGTRSRITFTGWIWFACFQDDPLLPLFPREELEAWEQDGLLTLHTAFSRDQVGGDFHENPPYLSPRARLRRDM